MKQIKSIEEIIYDYDNFIIDQWGVMHDGTFGYDHAFNTINILNSNHKNLFIISNSSKRSQSSIDKLPKLGFRKNSFSQKACCPTKMGEAFACGIPVIANKDVGDVNNIIKKLNGGAIIDLENTFLILLNNSAFEESSNLQQNF